MRRKILLTSGIILLMIASNGIEVFSVDQLNEPLTKELAQKISEGKIRLEGNRLDYLLFQKDVLDPEADDDGDTIKNKDEIYIYTKDGQKYIGYNSHPRLSDTDGDGDDDYTDVAPLVWNITARDMVMFMELAYREDSYIYKVLDEEHNLIDIFKNRQEYVMMHNELAPYWKIKESYHEGNGFDAVLFETESKYSYLPNNVVQVLAIRGTAGAEDSLADVNIFLGTDSKQVTSVKNVINSYANRSDITNLYVTGHSLGGYLSQRAIIEAKQKNYPWIKQAFTFNAPKIKGSGKTVKLGDQLTAEGKSVHYAVNNDGIIWGVGNFKNTNFVGSTSNGHGSRSFFEEIVSDNPSFQAGTRNTLNGTGRVSEAYLNDNIILEAKLNEIYDIVLKDNKSVELTNAKVYLDKDILDKVDTRDMPSNTIYTVLDKGNIKNIGSNKVTVRAVYPDATFSTKEITVDVVANKSKLTDELKKLETEMSDRVDLSNKTPKSKENFTNVLTEVSKEKDAAVKVKDEKFASQEKVDEETKKIQQAIEKLKAAKKSLEIIVDKTALKNAIKELEQEKENQVVTNATPNSLEQYKKEVEVLNLEEEIKKATEVATNDDASQSEVMQATEKIKELKAKLVEAYSHIVLKANKEALKEAKGLLEKENQEIDTATKTPESINKYKEELAKINASEILKETDTVLSDDNATTKAVEDAVAKVNETIKKLKNAKLLLKEKANKEKLQEIKEVLAKNSEKAVTTGKTPNSIEEYNRLYSEAKSQDVLNEIAEALANENIDQGQVDDLVTKAQNTIEKLNSAKEILKDKANKEKLEAILNQLKEEQEKDNTKNKTPNSIEKYNEKLQEIDANKEAEKGRQLLLDENVEQSKVNEEIVKIQEIINSLNKAKELLKDKANKENLAVITRQLEISKEKASTENKTPESVEKYNVEFAKIKADEVFSQAMEAINDENIEQQQVDKVEEKVLNTVMKLEEAKNLLVEKAEKKELETVKLLLNTAKAKADTTNKTPESVEQYNKKFEEIKAEEVYAEALKVLSNENATQEQVDKAVEQVKETITKLSKAKDLLKDKANKEDLVTVSKQLQTAKEKADTTNKTPESIEQYNKKFEEIKAEEVYAEALKVLSDDNATQEQVDAVVEKVKATLTKLNEAKLLLEDKKAEEKEQVDKTLLENVKSQLETAKAKVDTTNKTPESVEQYNKKFEEIKAEEVYAEALKVLSDDNATQEQVDKAVAQVKETITKLSEAKDLLKDKANKEDLVTASKHLQTAKAKADTTNKTPESVEQYNKKFEEIKAEEVYEEALKVLSNENATQEQVNAVVEKVKTTITKLSEAKDLLKDKANKEDLVTASKQLQTAKTKADTTNKTPESIEQYNKKFEEIKAEEVYEEALKVLSDDNATQVQVNAVVEKVKTTLTKLNEAKLLLEDKKAEEKEQVDKKLLENVKSQLETAKAKADTTNKTPESVEQYNKKFEEIKAEEVYAEALKVLSDDNATQDQVNSVVEKVKTTITKLNEAKLVLEDKKAEEKEQVDKTLLENVKSQLEIAKAKADTTNKTPESVEQYNKKFEEIKAEEVYAEALKVLSDDNATQEQVDKAVAQVKETITKLNEAKLVLEDKKAEEKVDKTLLESVKSQLETAKVKADTTNKTPESVEQYNKKFEEIKAEEVYAEAELMFSKADATQEQVDAVVEKVKATITKLNEAKLLLEDKKAEEKVDKTLLENVKSQLEIAKEKADTTNKTPESVEQYNKKFEEIKAEEVYEEALKVISNENATQEQVDEVVEKVKTMITKLNEAKLLLEDKKAEEKEQVDKTLLENVKSQLEIAKAKAGTTNKTPESVEQYNKKFEEIKAEEVYEEALKVLSDENATQEQVDAVVEKVKTTITKLNEAKLLLEDKKAEEKEQVDKTLLENVKSQLEIAKAKADTTNKTPESVEQYNKKFEEIKAEEVYAEALKVLSDDNATQEQVDEVVEKVKTTITKLNEAKSLLEDKKAEEKEQVDKTLLENVKSQLEIAKAKADTTNKTPESVEQYNKKFEEIKAEEVYAEALKVLSNENATQEQVNEVVEKVKTTITKLNEAKLVLEDKKAEEKEQVDKTLLENVKSQLEIAKEKADTTNKTPESIEQYNKKFAEIKAEEVYAEALKVLSDDNATQEQVNAVVEKVKTTITKLNEAKLLLEDKKAEEKERVDKKLLENVKSQLEIAKEKADTTNKTPESVAKYEEKLSEIKAEEVYAEALKVLSDDNATQEQVDAVVEKVKATIEKLNEAKALLEAKPIERPTNNFENKDNIKTDNNDSNAEKEAVTENTSNNTNGEEDTHIANDRLLSTGATPIRTEVLGLSLFSILALWLRKKIKYIKK